MIRLPHLVRGCGFAPMHQLVFVAVGGRIGGHGDLACRYRPDDTRDGRIAWCPVAFSDGKFLHLPVNGGDRGTRTLDGKVADKPDQVIRQVQPAPIGARAAREAGEAF